MFERTDEFFGGSLQGECLISPARLVEVFGKPDDADGYKVSGEYTFINRDESDGRDEAFTLYDWKHTTLYDEEGVRPSDFWASTEPYHFHIGGKGGCDIPAIRDAMAKIEAGEACELFDFIAEDRTAEIEVTDGFRLPQPVQDDSLTRIPYLDKLAATRVVIKSTRKAWDKRVEEQRIVTVGRDSFELFLRDLEEAAGLR